ncbi:methyl-accepting chemotaxis protein [Photobacterium sp. WH77]|uniref:Methyl-accepting chemotaxis protein n=1 Tax=Photobacterium arenosum TaxID=2774143 RepID=A0ABR9BPT0_9GAMM|nr:MULTISPECIES: methyl-accepting chemotaxis protein [Photobacterium]MBD8514548.1 methyl-accepting chemotaxis protein [Photobacterium arenosum]MCG2838168.1 methyl-accepting chemotaxis protein [Photobacterium sp. WH77]MCG2845786.1 methyl-accepting chemotaxis protein [Photobacterium sp. WH80]
MLINTLTLRTKLILAVLLPCIMLLLVGIISYSTMSQIGLKSERLYMNTATPMRAMAEVASRIPRMRVGIDMMLFQEIDGLKDAKGVQTRINETRTEDIPEMRAAIEQSVAAQINPELRREAQKLQQRFEATIASDLNPMLAALEKGNLSDAYRYYTQYAVDYGVMRQDTNTLLDTLLTQAETFNNEAQSSFNDGQRNLVMIIIVALIVSFLVSFIIIQNLRSRVAILQQTIKTAEQDMALSTRIELDGNDELNAISQTLNNFFAKIHRSVEEVAQSSRNLAKTAQAVASTAQTTQSNCLTQRDRTIQVATAINELGATVNEIANNAAQAAHIAKEATTQAQDGSQVVEQSREKMSELSNDLGDITGVIEALAHQVTDISAILDTIRSISEQTNLLALNAAIEAARAGEQGRGFAVVADEVRTLASRSAGSTEEIQEVINRLQNESTRAVNAISQGRQQGSDVAEQANQATGSLAQIATYIDQISEQNIQVATATEEQSSVVHEINRNIEDINHLTSETADIANELTASSGELQALSKQLDQLVGRFKL